MKTAKGKRVIDCKEIEGFYFSVGKEPNIKHYIKLWEERDNEIGGEWVNYEVVL